MAEWRKIHTKFWVDPEWLDFTPEDRYFYLCLLTNPKTTACGVYEVHIKEFAMWTGYNTETIMKLLEHFQSIGKIEYDEKTHEVFIKNWFRYNSPRSPKLHALIMDELEHVKSPRFRELALHQLELHLHSHQPNKTNGQKKDIIQDKCQDKDRDTVSDTVSIQYRQPVDTVSIQYPYSIDKTIDIDKDKDLDILSGQGPTYPKDTVAIQYPQPKDTLSDTVSDIVPIHYQYTIAKNKDKDIETDKDKEILSGKSPTPSKGEKDFLSMPRDATLRREPEVPQGTYPQTFHSRLGYESVAPKNISSSLSSVKGDIVRSEKDFQLEVEQVISELNRLTGRSFRVIGKQTSFIRARLREGFTVEDCLLVVRDRVRRWLNDEKMREYLRPSTLFNSEKFEGYLNEARSGPIESKNMAILKQYLAGGEKK